LVRDLKEKGEWGRGKIEREENEMGMEEWKRKKWRKIRGSRKKTENGNGMGEWKEGE